MKYHLKGAVELIEQCKGYISIDRVGGYLSVTRQTVYNYLKGRTGVGVDKRRGLEELRDELVARLERKKHWRGVERVRGIDIRKFP